MIGIPDQINNLLLHKRLNKCCMNGAELTGFCQHMTHPISTRHCSYICLSHVVLWLYILYLAIPGSPIQFFNKIFVPQSLFSHQHIAVYFWRNFSIKLLLVTFLRRTPSFGTNPTGVKIDEHFVNQTSKTSSVVFQLFEVEQNTRVSY